MNIYYENKIYQPIIIKLSHCEDAKKMKQIVYHYLQTGTGVAEKQMADNIFDYLNEPAIPQ